MANAMRGNDVSLEKRPIKRKVRCERAVYLYGTLSGKPVFMKNREGRITAFGVFGGSVAYFPERPMREEELEGR